MSIVPMKKVAIAAIASRKGELVKALHEWGQMHIEDIKASSSDINNDSPEASADLDTFISSIQGAIEFLDTVYVPEKKPSGLKTFLQSFFQYREYVPREYREHPERYIPEAEEATKKIQKLNKDYDRLSKEISEMKKVKGTLEGIRSLNIPLEVMNGTQKTRFYLIKLENKDMTEKLDALKKDGPHFAAQNVYRDKRHTIIAIVVRRKDRDAMDMALQEADIKEMIIPEGFKKTPQEELEKIESRMTMASGKLDSIVKEVGDLYEKKKVLLAVKEHLDHISDEKKIPALFGRSNRAIIVSGWIDARMEKELRDIVTSVGGCSVIISDPEPEDDPPIKLENSRFIRPLELITKMYSMPKYDEFDPTVLIAPFFIVYFAFCLSDAGYGLMLVIFSLLFMKMFSMGEDAIKLFKIMTAAGVLTIFVGALFGSWFGLRSDMLPSFLASMSIIDPMQDPTALLVFYLIIGVFQAIYVGNIISIAKYLKKHDTTGAILGPGMVLLFITVLGVYTISMMGLALVNSQKILLYGLEASFVLLFIAQMRNGSGIVGRIGAAIWETYNIVVGTMSDILSYSRLLALGLATTSIGMVFDYMGLMFMKGSGVSLVIGSLVGITIIIVGALFNLFISSMGAFIHSMRLQYVEYFSRFYEGGGRPFRPFRKGYNLTRIQVKTTEA